MSFMPKTSTVSVDRLHERLLPNYQEGRLYYKPAGLSWWDSQNVGRECFKIVSNGYYCGTIDKVRLLAHRVLFAMYYNYWPTEVDHINRDRKDNRIENLREVTHQENLRNMGLMSHNTSGVAGVSYHKRDKKWRAYIFDGAGQISLGYFEDKDSAILARLKAELEYNYVGNR